ncbi:MAG: EAL domain-containing protein [Cyanobium sp.]
MKAFGPPTPLDAEVIASLLDHIERPVALCDPQGQLRAFNNLFLHEAQQLGLDPWALSLQRSGHLEAQGRSIDLPLIRSDLGPQASLLAAAPLQAWQLLELPGRVVSLPTLSRIVEHLADPAAALLQVELSDPGAMRRRLGAATFEIVLDTLERRLLSTLPVASTLCRTRDERLLALLPGGFEREDLRRLAERWREQWERPVLLDGRAQHFLLCMGLSRLPQDGERFEMLLEGSEHALQLSQLQGGGVVCLAAPPPGRDPHAHHLAMPLAAAIDERRLNLLYQPIVELANGRLQGVEVLCRWSDPLLGTISPGEFIPVAEATEQINPLGVWMIEAVFAQMRRWRAAQLEIATVSLNISPLQLHGDGLVETLHRGLLRHGLSASGIILEVTENRAFDTSPEVRRRLWSLHELGFTLSMDDYGTGFSSVQRLTSLPFRALKVDRCLIEAIESDPLQQAVVRGVVDLQNSTGLEVVVEGVERAGQRNKLLELGCRAAQGFLFSRPLTAEALEDLLRDDVSLMPSQA